MPEPLKYWDLMLRISERVSQWPAWKVGRGKPHKPNYRSQCDQCGEAQCQRCREADRA